MVTSKKDKILAVVLSLAMTFTVAPQLAAPSYAASGDAAMVLGSESVLKNTANTDDAQRVWFGGSAWNVISFDMSGNQGARANNVMTLFASEELARGQAFNPNPSVSGANQYAGSELQSKNNDLYNSFATEEKTAIVERTLTVQGLVDKAPYSNGIEGKETKGYLWPLSSQESYYLPNALEYNRCYWLRSPGDNAKAAAFTGNVQPGGYQVYWQGGHVEQRFDVRPALYLHHPGILFTSAADGGKNSGNPGPDALAEVGQNSSNEWKLTLRSGHGSFRPTSASTCDGKTVTIKYEGAQTGSKEFISALIINKYGRITYYGRIKNCSSGKDANGEVSINLVGKMGSDDKLYIFNENFNGDKTSSAVPLTDYASELNEVSITPSGHSWEFDKFDWKTDFAYKPGEDGYYKAKAQYVCKNDNTHVDSKDATVSLKKTDATCTTAGEYFYTAVIDANTSLDKAKHEESTAKTEIPATGHDWQIDDFTWTADKSKKPGDQDYYDVKGNYVCTNDQGHKISESAQTVRLDITKPATCTEAGECVYEAQVNNPGGKGVDKDQKTEAITAIDHAWGSWEKADDKQHRRICSNDTNHVEYEEHIWDAGRVSKEPTDKVEGILTQSCTVCAATKESPIPVRRAAISGPSLAKITAKGKKSLVVGWSRINGADGYDIFFSRCSYGENKMTCKKIKTIRGNNIFAFTKKGLKKRTAYKAYVKAYVIENGSKRYVNSTPLMHSYTSGGTKKYTNAKSVKVNKSRITLKKGKKYKIKAKVNKLKKSKKLMPKGHAPALRYMTSNSAIATVSKSGRIKAKDNGTCYIYVFAHNGVAKRIKVTVK